ncbi:hypothetical protein, variant [Saprolegnia diclina VS20]|uniref:Deleted in lung and esophageal cancer protein 1 Ig-like domain-containing protein n=1 Tax=Saprolegnia diclina (strain VS20) TaxID=1156394 RepID=T0QHX4_SAPDV|nr:hypothetical protein, variant [Saprolegnia diclina VS20]EQC37574.1 hypothetical protein, variant [Saprolegnia diclina VS20]|eukprot:XP_008609094.1 hypothetical protein, variant [Saprolegnia diclina VS20]
MGPTEDDNQGPVLKDEDVVAVGSISNVLRRAFRDYYTDDFDERLNSEWATPAPKTTSENHSNDADNNDNNNDQATDAPEEPEHPYLVYGRQRVAEVEADLRAKVQQATDLMALLETRRREALEKDDAQARELIKQGLVVKAQIPIGPSNFRLDPAELEPFGEFARSLIQARTLLEENHLKMLDRSGNGPTAQIKAAKAAIETPGYLKSTSTVQTRKDTTLHKFHMNEHGDDEYISDFVDEVVPRAKPKPKAVAHTISTDDAAINNKILHRMQSTLNFVRNPRFDTAKITLESEPPFVVQPHPVEFLAYEIGGIYEQLVLIKNMSAISCRCRVLPPATAFFMIASVQFPDASGLIAPGLSCQVRIQFAPDTRADYNDVFVVMMDTPQGTDIPVQVPILAHREPPQLSIPSTLQAHCCLIGGDTCVTTISCLNQGGRGRFWLMTEDEWENALLHSSLIDHINALAREPLPAVRSCVHAALCVGPFQLSPSAFDLQKGAVVELKLTYTPTMVGHQVVPFVVVCDNCLVKTFQLAGEGCEIYVFPIAVNQTAIETKVQTMGPLDRLLFPPLVVESSSSQTFELWNDTRLDLPFKWQLQEPSVFRVAPPQGTLTRQSALRFHVTFEPTKVASFATTASLMILNVPPFCLPVRAADRVDGVRPPLTSVVAMQLLLEGTGRHALVKVAPSVVAFGAAVPQQQPLAVNLTLTNSNDTQVHFDWHALPPNATITPTTGVLSANSSTIAKLQYTPLLTGGFALPLTCHIGQGLKEPSDNVSVWVEGTVPRPHIRLLSPEIDFGLVSVGHSATQVLRFRNESTAITSYRFSHVGASVHNPAPLKRSNSNESLLSRFSMVSSEASKTDDEKTDTPPRCVITFTPEEGSLLPGEVGQVSVLCMSGKYPERFRASFQCELLQEPLTCASFISARAEIQCPQVYLTITRINLGTTYIGVPVQATCQLINVSNLPASFKWVEPQGRSKAYTIEFEPKAGNLISKESLTITVTFTGRVPGFTNAVFACNVRGLLAPLGFELSTLQKGLVLSYELLKPNDPLPELVPHTDAPAGALLPKLQFGEEVALFERKTLRLLIRNHSGIPAKVSFEAKKYAAATTETPPENLLEPPQNVFQSAQGQQYKAEQANVLEDRRVLSLGHGVALVCYPAALTIAEWEQAVVHITCFNNMSGRYVDDIIVKLDTMPPVRLSATINVVGCPLSINPNCVGLLMKNAGVWPVLEYGMLPLHSESVVRKVQIINTGPIPAKLVWKLLEYPDPDSLERVVDLRIQVLDSGSALTMDQGLQVTIRPHLQKEASSLPFQVEPQDKIVPKHGHATFQMTFFPARNTGIGLTRALLVADAEWLHNDNDGVDHGASSATLSSSASGQTAITDGNTSSAKSIMMGAVGKALKAVRLTNSMAKYKNGSLNMKSLACLKLAMSGHLIQPHLHWDKGTTLGGLQCLTFTTWSLYTKVPDHPLHTQAIQLVNRMATKLTFRLETSPDTPFYIVEATSVATPHPLSPSVLSPAQRSIKFNQQPAPCFTLGPGQSVHVKIHYIPKLPPPTSSRREPAVVFVSGALTIRFSQGTLQTIELQGRILRPILVLAPSHFKFGLVHCEHHETVKIFLSNPTEVDAHFTVHHVPQLGSKTVDDPSVFQLSLTSGTLRGPSLPLHNSGALVPSPSPQYQAAIHRPLEVLVTFAPKAAASYKCRFHFNVELGDGFDLVLEGHGTLDEGKTQKVSRSLPRAQPLRHSHFMFGAVSE